MRLLHRPGLVLLLSAALSALLAACPASPPVQPPAPPTPRPTAPSEEGVEEVDPSALGPVQRLRVWDRPSPAVPRVRLGRWSDGKLAIAWMQKKGPKLFGATLEDAQGRLLWSQGVRVGVVEYHPLLFAGALPLLRDDQRLVLGGSLLGLGEWEAYAGVEEGAIAWQPCASGPCPASLFRSGSNGWEDVRWAVETFGIDLLQLEGPGSGTIAIATRENPKKRGCSNSGWALRTMLESDFLGGMTPPLSPQECWVPPAGTPKLSLEDPMLVRGAPVPLLVGTAQRQDAQNPGLYHYTGRVFVAEARGPLQERLQVAASPGNQEIHGVVFQGRLFLTAEVDATASGLFGWKDGGFELVARVPGGGPCVAVAEGELWLSSSKGLWKLRR